MRARTTMVAAAACAALSVSAAVYGQPLVPTEFTYQGQLKQDGAPFNGVADVYFGLYDALDDGTFVGGVTKLSVPITDGLFDVTLDFGAHPFLGEPCWLRIGVRYPAGTGSWVFLAPRQQVTAVPYALHTRGIYCSNAGRVGVGTDAPMASLHVGDIGEYNWGRGDGWGDFSLNNGTLGFSIGVATGGLGTGDVYLWPTGGTERMFLATPTDGEILTVDNDRIGIGTVNPQQKLHVTDGDARFDGDLILHDEDGNAGIMLRPNHAQGVAGEISVWNDDGNETVEIIAAEGSANGGQIVVRNWSGEETIQIDGDYGSSSSGYISITGGNQNPALYASNTGSGRNDATIRAHNTQASQGMAGYFTNNSYYATMHVENNGPGPTLWLVNKGGGGIIVASDATRSIFWVDGTGKTNARVLQIHGGADLSEGFDVRALPADPAATGHGVQAGTPEPGMVVSIDPAHPGKLVVSSERYDRKVAGIISGAGDVQPGMLMGQDGSAADGDHPVALTGRVYCRCVTSNGPIEPGDLLTTSDTAGHAMKVTDYPSAQGAILGKAMTALHEGQGLVLVLVSLQ